MDNVFLFVCLLTVTFSYPIFNQRHHRLVRRDNSVSHEMAYFYQSHYAGIQNRVPVMQGVLSQHVYTYIPQQLRKVPAVNPFIPQQNQVLKMYYPNGYVQLHPQVIIPLPPVDPPTPTTTARPRLTPAAPPRPTTTSTTTPRLLPPPTPTQPSITVNGRGDI
ncbi:endoglucanase A-like [Acipenser ruthenus]|uniref:endoglucanase A-like n=1 Tax=Acipenser ruthenus TaxID=7906 RepID=UPI002740A690|nr:endoglucanase A-like [Acipenser ruthenus]